VKSGLRKGVSLELTSAADLGSAVYPDEPLYPRFGVDEPSLQFWERSTGIRTSLRRRNHGIKGGLYRAKTDSPICLSPRLEIHSINCSFLSS